MTCNVLEYLEKATNNFPDKIVFGDENKEITYKNFTHTAKKIGATLAMKGAYLKPIVVFVEKDIESILAFFSAVYSGCFYVPIDKTLPKERIETILSVVASDYVLLKTADKAFVEELGLEAEKIYIDEFMKLAEANNLSLSERNILENIKSRHLDTNPLYMMFTSGSTGVPKGVLISHKSVIDMAEQFSRVFQFQNTDVFANQAPFDFDVSVKDIYLTIRNSATMYIVPKSMFVLPKKLSDYLNEKKVTTVIWAASAMGVVAAFKAFDKKAPEHLNRVMFSGEVLPIKVLHYWQKYKKDATYVNLYGPTEITCNCTYYIVDREFSVEEVLPIGQAFPNTEILLLDENNHPAEAGKTGEICVRGSSLALGYYKAEEATKKAFCQNPLHDNYHDLIYRTGDMGYVNERGELVFAARKDHQIKHMGHRIELLEIEAVVNAMEEVEKCCCIYDSDREKIVLFYQAETEIQVQIIKSLQKKLPKYMCPNIFCYMEKMPENSHGKIDRYKLKQDYLEKKSE